METSTERCLKYIESLRFNGRTTKEVKDLLKVSDFSRIAIKEALKLAKKLQLVRVYPLGIPTEFERLM